MREMRRETEEIIIIAFFTSKFEKLKPIIVNNRRYDMIVELYVLAIFALISAFNRKSKTK
jgi:LytS/YehU family sensor histidine kinase